MKAPQHLSHKPIVAVHDYDKLDGHYANNTDARALSLGQAQYDQDEISAKVFRHTGKNWSRQSEELPLHRVLDLAILISASMLPGNQQQGPHSSLQEKLTAPERYQELLDYFKLHAPHLTPRLRELKQLLIKLNP